MTVRFEKVSYRYPGGAAGVFDIDLEIGEGELLAVIGASGSGKTTLLRLLSGFVLPDSGRILVDGKDITGLAPERRELGVVFQNYALFPHMTLRDNVAYALKLRGMAKAERRAKAGDMLRRVGLAGMEERLPAALSGGQQQRVALSRALVFSPRALLLDEPLSALDAGIRLEMRAEIRHVQQSARISTLHVTHDQEEAFSIADRVAIMRDGRLIQVAAPKELYDRPVNRTVAAFVGQANLWDGTVRETGLVEAPFGRLACDTQDHAPGTAVTILVRPERIFPTPFASAPNSFTGRPASEQFLGPIRRIELSLGPVIVKVETHIRDEVQAVSIPPEAIRLLPADEQAANKLRT